MTELIIIVSPAFDRCGKRRHGRFDLRLQGVDEIICEATQQPMLDASRALMRRGVDPSTTICKVRAESPTVVTMRAPIGVAAQYDVMGGKFVRRKRIVDLCRPQGLKIPCQLDLWCPAPAMPLSGLRIMIW